MYFLDLEVKDCITLLRIFLTIHRPTKGQKIFCGLLHVLLQRNVYQFKLENLQAENIVLVKDGILLILDALRKKKGCTEEEVKTLSQQLDEAQK